MPATEVPIQNVSDTARWVAVYRALESERPDALFHDPYARRLAGERGEAIVRAMPRGRQWGWPMVVRTCVMDEIIERAIARHGTATVLNLAAGLDARPYRMKLPPGLRWVEVDLPEILDYKQQVLAGERPVCELETVRADLTDASQRQALFARVATAKPPVLVVSEGLLVYLEDEQVRALAANLHCQASFRWWLIDLASPRLLKMMERTWGSRLAASGAPFRFAPEEGTGFFEPLGWKEAEFRSTWEESLRLNRTVPLAWLWNFLGRLQPKANQEAARRMSGIVLFERT